MRVFLFKGLLSFVVSLLGVYFVLPQTDTSTVWKAPPPRLKEKTIFAPKPTTGNNIFKGEAEKWLADAVKNLEAGDLTPIKDKWVSDYVTQVGKNLALYSAAPKTEYEFIVLDNEEVNAMNMGAGRIYINLGTLKAVENEDELVGIIAHEIGHDAFHHADKTITRQLFWMKGIRKITSPADAEKALEQLVEAYQKNPLAAFGENLLGFARNDELQADKAAFYNVYKAGYNPRGLTTKFTEFDLKDKKEQGGDYTLYQFLTFFFGDHPPSSFRATALKWESNWVKMPANDERYKNAAFDAMKAAVAKL